MLQGYMRSAKSPFFVVFRRFTLCKRFARPQSRCRQGTPFQMVPNASLLSIEYSSIVFLPQINAFKILQGSIPAPKTTVFCLFFAILTIFTFLEALYKRHTFLIATFCKPLFRFLGPQFFAFFFANSTIFTSLEALYTRHTYLSGTFCFVFVHRIQPDTFPSPFWDVQNSTRLYSSCQTTVFRRFSPF